MLRMGIAAWGCALVLLAGCPEIKVAENQCSEGMTRPCLCDDGSPSLEVCDTATKQFSACDCGGGDADADATGDVAPDADPDVPVADADATTPDGDAHEPDVDADVPGPEVADTSDTEDTADAEDTDAGCVSASECDDGDPCTNDSCAAGTCEHAPIDCDDDDSCTEDSCDPGSGECVNVGSCDCTVDSDCDDGNACTVGTCDTAAGTCSFAPGEVGVACDDGNACTLEDSCNDAGKCLGATKPCPSGACEAAVCDPDTGECGTTPVAGGTCDDGDPCTETDVCQNDGTCLGTVVSCDDGKTCTMDNCDPGSGDCVFVNVCDCLTASDCDNGNPCTVETCVDGGCVSEPSPGSTCDDGNPCTDSDACTTAGGCTGSPLDCDDGNPCTADSCDGGTCVNTPTPGQPCTDPSACTNGDQCQADGTCLGTPKVCNDGNPCTADSCDPATGQCQTTPSSGSSCNDNDPCTQGDTCQSGACYGEPIICQDSNPCTDDLCDASAGGCTYPVLVGNACDDGDPCTVNDQCATDGSCGGQQQVCDDGIPCTDDVCQGGGCQYLNNDAYCDDGNPCTDDFCVGPGVSGDGCDHPQLPDGYFCGGGDICAPPDGYCQSGACVSQQPVCDDGNPCTIDACDVEQGGCYESGQITNQTSAGMYGQSCLRIPNPFEAWKPLDGWTIELWVRRESGCCGGDTLLDMQEGDSGCTGCGFPGFLWAAEGGGQCLRWFESNDQQQLCGVPQGPWMHLAVVRDGPEVRVYRDGNQEDQGCCFGGPDNLPPVDLYVGCRFDDFAGFTDYFWQGAIDQIRISRTARYQPGIFFEPPMLMQNDAQTVALYYMEDESIVSGFVPDESGVTGDAMWVGPPPDTTTDVPFYCP